MDYKKYSILFLSILCLLIISCVGTTWYVDPYFHYHEPNKHLDYHLGESQRYQNDGIVRNFKYDAIITGTSMTENFKTSEFNKLFNVNSIKVPFSGASYKEINDNLRRAIQSGNHIKYIIRALDYSWFFSDENAMAEDFIYPTYLTNDNILDDISYLLNKDILFSNVFPTLQTYSSNGSITSFDEYSNWNSLFIFGKESVLSGYSRVNSAPQKVILSEEEKSNFQENINKNIVSIVKDNSDIQFYYFLTPYSIIFWDDLNQKRMIEKHLIGEQMMIESLVEYKNVHLFSFSNNFDLTTNLDNYKDIAHYSEDINSYILKEMKLGNYRLTKDNYEKYLSDIKTFYLNYDYDSLFK